MTFWIENYFICFALSAVLAGFIIPKVLLIAFRRQLFDEVNERKIHKGAVPRLGGIAFLPSLIFSICIVLAVDLRTEIFVMGVQLHETIVPIFFLICALMLMYLTGIADDLIGVRYRGKFIFQIIAGALIAMSGLYIRNLFGFFGIGAVNAWLGVAATIFLAIFVINAINLIDGIDGLASGLSAITLAYYSYIFYQAGEYIYAMLAGATLGTLVPFFYYNVFGNAANHTKIFMGDTGSLTIGTILSFLSMAVFNLRPDQAPDASENLFVLAVTPLLIPLLDVVRVFCHRVRKHNNPFLPDRCHIHHKLLALGFRTSTALITILVTDALFISFNFYLSPFFSPTWIILFDTLIWVVFNWLLTRLIRSREKKTGIRLYD